MLRSRTKYEAVSQATAKKIGHLGENIQEVTSNAIVKLEVPLILHLGNLVYFTVIFNSHDEKGKHVAFWSSVG